MRAMEIDAEAQGRGSDGECRSSRALKQQRMDDGDNEDFIQSSPILGLPDDVLTLVFARLPRHSLVKARRVCTSWKRVAEQQELALLRRKMGVTEGWIYLLAGSKGTRFSAYDPIADKWFTLPPAPGHSKDRRWQGFACVGLGHRVLLIGGTRSQMSPYSARSYPSKVVAEVVAEVVCSDVLIYDALTNKWSKGANMNTPRSWAAAAVVGNKVYVAGGQANTKFLNTAEVYDPEIDSWQTISSMEVERSSCQGKRSSCKGVALDGQFWVIAGETEEYLRKSSEYLKRSAEVYDVETDSWRFVPEMSLHEDKVMAPCAVVNGTLVCEHLRTSIMSYKKEINEWHKRGDIFVPYSRNGFACESVGSKLYIIGGRTGFYSRRRIGGPMNTLEICDLGQMPQPPTVWESPSLTLGADIRQGHALLSASTVAWL